MRLEDQNDPVFMLIFWSRITEIAGSSLSHFYFCIIFLFVLYLSLAWRLNKFYFYALNTYEVLSVLSEIVFFDIRKRKTPCSYGMTTVNFSASLKV